MRSALLFGSLAASVAWMGASCVGPAPTRALPGSGGSTTSSSSGGGAVGGGGSGQGGTPGCGDGRWERGEVCYDAPIIFQESGHPRPFFAMLDGNDFHDIAMVPVVAGVQRLLLQMDDGSAGSFQTTLLNITLDYSGAEPFVVGDFDRDGFDDLLFRRLGTSGGALELWSNDQALGFTGPTDASIITGSGTSNRVVEVVSLIGDGRDDVIVAYCKALDCSTDAAFDVYSGGNTVSVVFNDQELGGLREPMALSYDPNGAQPGVLAVVGVNGMGMPLLEFFSLDVSPAVDMGAAESVTNETPRDVVVGQLDGAGSPDAVVTSSDPRITVVFDASNPTRDVIDIGVPARQVELVDMDNDDDLDIVLGMAGRIHWLPNEGTGSFGPLQPLGGLGESGERFDVADVNGDGAPDFVSYSPSNNGTSVFLSAP